MTIKPAKEIGSQTSIRQLQARLNALPGNQNNAYTSNEWVFRDNRQNTYTISFTIAEKVLKTYPEWLQLHNLDSLTLTKQLTLSLAERTGITNYQQTYRGLLVWLAAFANNNIMNINRDILPDIFRFRLTHSISAHGTYPTREVVSYGGISAPSILKLQEACDEIALSWFDRHVTNDSIKSCLKTLIPELTDGELTYRDWRDGKSFNLLTLDYGQYYVEHCSKVFEAHYPLALALRQTQNEAVQIANSLNISLNSLNSCLARILEGQKAEDIEPKAPNYIDRIQQAVLSHFTSNFRQSSFEHQLLRHETIDEITELLALPRSTENGDRLRVIILHWLQNGYDEELHRLLNECQAPVSWSLFEQTVELVKRRHNDIHLSIPTPQFFAELGFTNNQGYGRGVVSQYIDWVAKAGLTVVIALTGWRKSEFGFPRSAVRESRNMDKLDEYAFPHRYQVDWHVHKTNGQIRTLREITFGIFSVIVRLQCLHNRGADQPCLYAVSAEKSDPSKSEGAVDAAVINTWPHFVHHYSDFKTLDDLHSWSVLKKTEALNGFLTEDQHSERKRLLLLCSPQEWEAFTVDENLTTAWRRARSDWPRISFMWSKKAKSARGWAVKYRQNTLRRDWTEILDAHLSGATREWFFGMSVEEIISNKQIGATIKNEIMADLLYPSPHAFRHMWAESVYRRFDGDAGWMIRSQFKHITRRMWLTYIRDKDNRFDHQRAKLSVTNSLVENFLNHKGERHTGQMAVLLRRLAQKTKVLTPDEQKEMAATLATQEIENLKSNPWGYCLLMRRSRHKAKCASGGEPMRHNASPELCLGCIHNLMQTSNVEWMIFHLQAHVEALNNPVVPLILKKSSYELVRTTVSHIRKLDPNHDALPELETALTNYQSAI